METTVLTPDAAGIAEAASILRSGGLVAFPTETVYGLGANALDAQAVAGIFAAKGRPSNNPLIVHVADVSDAVHLAGEWPKTAQQLADRFWPGPLTLVVPTSSRIPPLVTANGTTLAVRVPAHPVALALLQSTGLPLAAPSANRSFSLSPTRAEHVLAGLTGRIAVVLDGGPTPGGIESTVLDTTMSPPCLLRPGPLSPGEIEAVVGPIARAGAMTPHVALRSPGLLHRHYAPRTPLECTADDGWARVEQLHAGGLRVGWLTFGEGRCSGNSESVLALAMPTEARAYAAQLFAALHVLDCAGVARIVVALPPGGEEWLAIQDRLSRATAPGPDFSSKTN